MTLQSDSLSGAEGTAFAPEVVAARYRLERPIGRGGMASVYEAVELSSERTLALKRLHALEDVKKRRRATQLFEREFHTLSHLAHPRVVEVYDYGVDDSGPFYTMELLDGGDLHRQAPVPWQRACALARDICSALSLLHSRRMVHRDLSPRNVRCTSDGNAKLIDFGAMVAMGPNKQVVGTPAYCAPECLNMQVLDQRADLYSLGATLYYTLLGRHAYPARDFAALREVWRGRVLPPSALNSAIPPALDALVLDLLNLDPAARPANAAEVMQRLAAIEGRVLDEHLLVSQSYLSTPTLVGRELALGRARGKAMRAVRGRGGAVLVEGVAGVGRSRFLDACTLEAKLLGALVLRADANDGRHDYAAVQALCAQLLDVAPEPALAAARPKLAVLGHALPALLEREAQAQLSACEDSDRLRSEIQVALREWLLEVSHERPMMMAIDDVHAIDEPSAAFIALLAHEARRSSLSIVVSCESGAQATSPSALQVLKDTATLLALSDLSPADSERLLRSVFGDVAHVQYVAHRLHAISSGNPRDLMQLAQHLVDRGLVRYQAGAWSLPATIDAGDLPENMAQAFKARIDALGTGARELGAALSLCPEREFGFDECLLLSGGDQPGLMKSLDALLEAQVVLGQNDAYVLARRAWINPLRAALDEEGARRLHARLAAVFELRGDESFRVAKHLLRAGELDRGLSALVAHAQESQRITHQNPDAFYKLVQSLPPDWVECYAQAIALCEQRRRPKRDAYTLRSRLAGLAALIGIVDRTHVGALLEHLCAESGLADWHALDPGMEPMARLTRALELAQARYAAASDDERVLEPIVAIRQLARASIEAVGVATAAREYAMLLSLPALTPLEPLSPALSVVSALMRGTTARIGGRLEHARREYLWLLERTAQPDRAGLEPSHHRYARTGVMFALGLIDSCFGLESCLDWAREIEVEPSHRGNALLIRMLYHLWQGQMHEAEQCKERIELARIQNSPRQWFEGAHLTWQIAMHAAVDDLTRAQQTADDIAGLARAYPGWVPVHEYATGEHYRIRGDLQSALAVLQRALSRMEPGCHQIWPNAAGAHVRVLCELGRCRQARELAQSYLERAEQADHGQLCDFIRMPLAEAQALLGETAEAARTANAVIEGLRVLGSQGLLLALAYETRARVAIAARDQVEFDRHAALCAEQLRRGSSSTLSAKFEKLKQAARRSELQLAADVPDPVRHTTELLTASQLTSLLDGCRGTAERARHTLGILLRHSGITDGFLYLLSEHGPDLAAHSRELEKPERMAALVRESRSRQSGGQPREAES